MHPAPTPQDSRAQTLPRPRAPATSIRVCRRLGGAGSTVLSTIILWDFLREMKTQFPITKKLILRVTDTRILYFLRI